VNFGFVIYRVAVADRWIAYDVAVNDRQKALLMDKPGSSSLLQLSSSSAPTDLSLLSMVQFVLILIYVVVNMPNNSAFCIMLNDNTRMTSFLVFTTAG
jgi:hypothetical protein